MPSADTCEANWHPLEQVRRLLDTKREDMNRMPMLLDVSRAFAEVLINYLITEKLDVLEVCTCRVGLDH